MQRGSTLAFLNVSVTEGQATRVFFKGLTVLQTTPPRCAVNFLTRNTYGHNTLSVFPVHRSKHLGTVAGGECRRL